MYKQFYKQLEEMNYYILYSQKGIQIKLIKTSNIRQESLETQN